MTNDVEPQEILGKLEEELAKAKSLRESQQLWRTYLGKKGLVKLPLKELSKLPAKERKIRGPLVQKLQRDALALFRRREAELRKKQTTRNLSRQTEILGLSKVKVGHLHPVTVTIRTMNRLFASMGFSIMDGPEIETDEYCFQRLNVPADHPARDLQDTIYIKKPDILLRTQTSSIEARFLEKFHPPLKVVSPGRVYRNETVNKSNHFIFHHYQGVVVMERVSLKDLFGTFNFLFKKMYGPKVIVRYRNKYYPEVEPGVGPDMRCFSCQGKGCSLCKGAGWIEMGGAGIIHPNVMKMAGLDAKKWMGFAFGLGLDRWVMAKYNITDIRTLLGGNLGYRYYENEAAL